MADLGTHATPEGDICEFKCYYCSQGYQLFGDIISHTSVSHGEQTLKIRTKCLNEATGKVGYQTKMWNIVPANERAVGKIIFTNEKNRTLKSKKDADMSSPLKKKMKSGRQQATTYARKDLFGSKARDNSVTDLLSEMQTLMPSVIDNLNETGRIETFRKFVRMVSENRFPLQNIAWLLFLDVVDYVASDNTVGISYNNRVTVLFWKIGYKLMHGKFLRYCGGFKNQGQVISGETEKGYYSPESAAINFAVPDLKTLQKEETYIDINNIKPGIINDMVETFSQGAEHKTYKICVDGKKINGCNDSPAGQINMFGFEGPPSIQEREDKMQSEQTLVQSFMTFLEELDVKNKVDFCSLSDTDRDTLLEFVKQTVLLFSNRVKDVREHHVKKETALTKFKKLGGNDWRKSKYAIVISHIQTWMYQGNSSVESILSNLDKLCCAIAQANDLRNCYHEALIDLGNQENYICLQEADSSTVLEEGVDRVINPRSIKQGSELWHRLRSSAKVTGSTAYKALGLESLKKQQEHFDYVFCKQDKPEFSTRTKLCLDHGVKNEINCVATLVSKVLPVYFPELSFKEEGCNVEELNGSVFFVCSPDGSCGIGGDGDPVLACEFKCPMPGNTHATPVHYKIPIYYAIQLLAEMNTLQTDKLLYMSYSEQSSTVFQVRNDRQLWLEILDELQRVYGTEIPKRPAKKSAAVEILRDKLKKYLDSNCEFLGEFKSVKAQCCVCSLTVSKLQTSADVVGYNCVHENDNTATSHIISLDEVKTAIKKLNEDLGSVDRLTMSQATEILVYILSDLDRNRSLDKPHAVPIGYALKGYSLPVTLFRKMLLHALRSVNELVYCPISCFDGQWFPVVSRCANDKPLTLIQVQKDCLKEAKSLSKPAIISAVRSCYRENDTENETDHAEDCLSITNSNTLRKALVGEKVKLQLEETTKAVDQGNPVIDILPQSALSDNEIVQEILEIEASLQNESSEVAISNREVIQCSNVDFEDHIASQSGEGAEKSQNPEDTVSNMNDTYTDTDCEKMLLSLKADPKRQPFWLQKSLKEFQDMIKTTETANKYLQKCDILVCLRSVRDKPRLQSKIWKSAWTKPKLLETFLPNNKGEQITKQETKGRIETKSCFKLVPLKELCLKVIDDKVKSISKEVLNVVYAELIYPNRLAEFRRAAPIKDAVKVLPFDLPKYWYCQPEFLPQFGIHHFSFIDPTHILTNLRTKICTTGIEERNLKRSSWLEVAKECKINKTGLNRSVIEDVIDKQNVGYALKLFSLEVEQVLEEKGKLDEARFCHVIREWYEAEDDRGIPVEERCRCRLQLRSWLLDGIDLEQFCWYGRYVKGIPIVTFESLIINIDRRLQLYPFTKSGSYNVRTIGSLENEEFFGEFHELDPKHVGLLHPNDIQTVMHTALEVSSARLNSDRGFTMRQSSKRVYPLHEVDQGTDMDVDNRHALWRQPELADMKEISPRDHAFDLDDRKKTHRRKKGEISLPGAAAKGAKPIRDLYKVNETRLFDHVRGNICLPDWGSPSKSS